MARSLLLLVVTATPAAAYLQPARPVQLDRSKWDTFEPRPLEQHVTQPPLSEKTLWERALERQEWDTLQQTPPTSSSQKVNPTKRRPGSEAPKKASWERLATLAASGEVVQGEILTVNGGGAICRVHGRSAFCPNSHLGDGPARVGQTLPLTVLRAHASARRLVVSHREARRATLRPGDVVRGVVTSHRPYGAFVTFDGGLRGLLHRRNISVHNWKLVRGPEGYVVDECFRHEDETGDALLAVGSAVTCLVTGHNADNGRISLSTRALEARPGDMLRDPAGVFDGAEAAAAAHRERRALEQLEYEILAEMCEENSLSSLLNDLLP